MPLLARFLSWVFSASALYCAAAVGQLGYHIEIADEKTGQVAFGNDTDVAIEAYHISARCGPAGTKFQYDSLETYGDHLGFAIPKGWHSPTHLYLPPRERTITMHRLTPQRSGCVWQPDIDGVIFADGTYAGDTTVVEMLQAFRAGMAAALETWSAGFARLEQKKLTPEGALQIAPSTNPTASQSPGSAASGMERTK
jgi:hypothetical protein